MKHQGSVLGGALLITGSCIGVGMLALPILSGLAGFYPSLLLFFLSAVFMTLTALLLVDISSTFKRPVSFISMVEGTLGKGARTLFSALYLALFYALLVAYVVGSGNHVAGILPIPAYLGSAFFCLVFGGVIYLGMRPVDFLNRILMVGKIAAYLLIIVFGMRFVTATHFDYTNDSYILMTLPVLIISFGFHNMIPSIYSYLQQDVKRTRQAILLGVGFTFVVYILWQVIALGTLPSPVIEESYSKDIDAAEAIKTFLGASWIGAAASVMAFFAILTSFLAQGLGLVHFLQDGFKIKVERRENPWMCLLALLPPLLFSILFPGLFFKALNFAGGICAVVLFGLFPVVMAWKGKVTSGVRSKVVLGGIFAFALFVFSYQLITMVVH
jgi:tyrosine-specific transport protein